MTGGKRMVKMRRRMKAAEAAAAILREENVRLHAFVEKVKRGEVEFDG